MLEAEIRVFADPDRLATAAAEQILHAAQKAVARRGRFSLVLSGGGTPQTLYRLLAAPPYQSAVPWPQTNFFWGDERCVPPDHEASNFGQAQRLLLAYLPIRPDQVYRMPGELAPDAAAEAYALQLQRFARMTASGRDRRWPRFDLVLLGMGSDGHTASLFPGDIPAAETGGPAMAVTADYAGRPANRVTLTPLVLNDARLVLFLVVGASKAKAAAAVLQGPPAPEQWPAQRIKPVDGRLLWLLDEEAARRLSRPV